MIASNEASANQKLASAQNLGRIPSARNINMLLTCGISWELGPAHKIALKVRIKLPLQGVHL